MSGPNLTTSGETVQFIALLHAINLGKTRKVNMAELRKLLESKGYWNVQTYIQSGNVVFRTGPQAEADLKAQLEAELLEAFGFPIPVTLRTAAQWKQEIAACLPELLNEPVYVAFLSSPPTAQALEELRQRDVAPERWQVVGRTLYQTVPAGVKNLKLSHGLMGRVLGVEVTVRNWRTVQTIAGRLLDA